MEKPQLQASVRTLKLKRQYRIRILILELSLRDNLLTMALGTTTDQRDTKWIEAVYESKSDLCFLMIFGLETPLILFNTEIYMGLKD